MNFDYNMREKIENDCVIEGNLEKLIGWMDG